MASSMFFLVGLLRACVHSTYRLTSCDLEKSASTETGQPANDCYSDISWVWETLCEETVTETFIHVFIH